MQYAIAVITLLGQRCVVPDVPLHGTCVHDLHFK